MTDEQLFMVYKNNKQHIELLENGMNGLLQLIPEKEQFGLNSKMNSNSALKKKSDEIEILMKVIEEDFLLYNEKFGKINWSESIQEAKQKTAIPGQMALYILSPLTPLANKISDEVIIK